MAPDPEDHQPPEFELDERWSFVARKRDQAWVWVALCRRTRQVVACVIGDRSEVTCRRLWHAISAIGRGAAVPTSGTPIVPSSPRM